ncbi:MAG: hypothetical protein ACLFV7_06155, partial [Phycisphaerae bacterium]
MDQHVKETTGFVCRWLLLAVSVAGILAAAGATAAGLVSMSLSRKGSMAVSDTFAEKPGQKAWVVARATGKSMNAENNAMFSLSLSDGVLRLHPGYQGASYHQVATPAGSPERLKLIPSPYGPMPFRTFEGRSATIPPEREVWILDARLLKDVPIGELSEVANALPGTAELIVIQSGPPEELARQGLAVRRAIPRALVFCSLGKQQPFRPTFRRARQALQRQDHRGLHVVTPDGTDALALARQGVSVHLVGGTVDEPG